VEIVAIVVISVILGFLFILLAITVVDMIRIERAYTRAVKQITDKYKNYDKNSEG
jgi:hypothetical protein